VYLSTKSYITNKDLLEMNTRALILLLILVFLYGCGKKEMASKYQDLPLEQRQMAYLNAKREVIYSLVCENLWTEADEYKKAKASKEFGRFNEYFYEYPTQFKQLQNEPLYPLYKISVTKRLALKNIHEIDADFKDWEPPSIKELPCQNIVKEWEVLKQEWQNLQSAMPKEFYKQYTLWDELTDDFFVYAEKIGKWIFVFLLVAAITAYSIILHYGLIVEKNKEGLWLIVATPISAIYWEKYFEILFKKSDSFWWKIAISSIILSFVYSLIAMTVGRLNEKYSYKNKSKPSREEQELRNTSRLIEKEQLTSNDIFKAIERGDLNLIMDLIMNNPNLVECINSKGQTPLHTLTAKGEKMCPNDLIIAKFLVEYEADVNERTDNEFGWAPLHFLSASGEDATPTHGELTKYLLTSGADPNIKSAQGFTPIHFIAMNGSAETLCVLEALFEWKVDPNVTTDDGITTWRVLWQHGEEIRNQIIDYEKRYI
jgi:hypothetical protein